MMFSSFCPPVSTTNTTRARAWLLVVSFLYSYSGCYSQCQPEFPLAGGWLGGDNALSIPFSSNKTLWIFSDSFVGPVDSKDRSSSVIMANTAAIQTCTGAMSTVEYYWRKDSVGNPRPIFDTFSTEYKYWPTEIIEFNNKLYVVLHKVKPGPEANAEELFNFSLVGTTLAEIKNFKHLTPDKWKIRYIDWPAVFDPNAWNGAMTVHGRYLYTFIGRDVKRYNLVRVPLKKIETPATSMEYFSANNSWEPGYDRTKASVLIEGVIGGSVRYHKKINRWVMIYGPEFLSREILIRASAKITGPWTHPEIILEVPEQIEGDPLFHRTYFSYGAREHPSFCDEENGLLYVTYDCNSSDFDMLVKTMNIYIPRVVRVEMDRKWSAR